MVIKQRKQIRLKKYVVKQIFQRSYYEHIIRTEPDLFRIRQYIRDNPINWDQDQNNKIVQNIDDI